MSKDSIAVINGHEYKYRWNGETKEMDYLGPVGDSPSLTETQFRELFRAVTFMDVELEPENLETITGGEEEFEEEWKRVLGVVESMNPMRVDLDDYWSFVDTGLHEEDFEEAGWQISRAEITPISSDSAYIVSSVTKNDNELLLIAPTRTGHFSVPWAILVRRNDWSDVAKELSGSRNPCPKKGERKRHNPSNPKCPGKEEKEHHNPGCGCPPGEEHHPRCPKKK
jgi:hypothetical protein